MAKKTPNYPVFTDDDVKVIQGAAQTVWHTIGYDCLQGMAQFGYKKPRPVESVTMSRRDVLDVVLDAGRLDEELRRQKRPDLVEKFNMLDYKQQNTLVRPAFPHTRYGT